MVNKLKSKNNTNTKVVEKLLTVKKYKEIVDVNKTERGSKELIAEGYTVSDRRVGLYVEEDVITIAKTITYKKGSLFPRGDFDTKHVTQLKQIRNIESKKPYNSDILNLRDMDTYKKIIQGYDEYYNIDTIKGLKYKAEDSKLGEFYASSFYEYVSNFIEKDNECFDDLKVTIRFSEDFDEEKESDYEEGLLTNLIKHGIINVTVITGDYTKDTDKLPRIIPNGLIVTGYTQEVLVELMTGYIVHNKQNGYIKYVDTFTGLKYTKAIMASLV